MRNFRPYFILPCALAWLTCAPVVSADINADANVIFNWAEKSFPSLLPTHENTTQLPPWIFRYYPATSLYVAVNNQDSWLYYISAGDLAKGVSPTKYDSVVNLLKLSGNASSSTSNACDASQVPAGHTLTQVGTTVKIATNGCIVEPETADYCPQKSLKGGVSLLSTSEVVSTLNGVSETSKFVTCTINSAPVDYQVIESDLCYIKSEVTPPQSAKIKGRVVVETVSDCLKSNAEFVTDLFTDEFYFKTDHGFEKLKQQ